MGVSAEVSVKVKNSKLNTSGSLLITHWGMSGPAILRLSAWGAENYMIKNINLAFKSIGLKTKILMRFWRCFTN